MRKNLDQEHQEILKKLHLNKDQARKVMDLLAKESEKWNSGQQRRKEFHSGDRERGVGKRPETSFRSASLGRNKTSSRNFAPIKDDSIVYCTNSVGVSGGSFSASNVAPPVACAELNEICTSGTEDIKWNGALWGDELKNIVLEPYDTKTPKKKSSLDHLLIDIDVPSLKSLLV